MKSWRNILSYRTNTKFAPGARVIIDLTDRKREALEHEWKAWGRNEYPEGSKGVIISEFTGSSGPAWSVKMDNGIMDSISGRYPAFYQKDLKLI